MAKLRSAEAVWEGGLQDGAGVMRFGSGAFEGSYTFESRFGDGAGTNPEELIAAAQAGCFSMALSADLGKAGFTPQRIETLAQARLEKVDGKNTITEVHLETRAEVPGIDEETFQRIAEGARQGCPVSRALGGVQVTLEARLVRS
jgi:osmotically inducible protein OsmC